MDQAKEDPVSDTRIRIPDPTLMRRAASRMLIGLVIVLILTTFFTVGGISMVVAGELSGLPFAVGGAIIQLALIVMVIASLNVRRTLTDDTISRATLASARRAATFIRRTALVSIVALLLFGLIRVVLGDPGTLLTAGLISVALWAVAFGARRQRIAYDHSLSRSS